MRNCYQSDNCSTMTQTVQADNRSSACGCQSRGAASYAASPCGCQSRGAASYAASPCGCQSRGAAPYATSPCGCSSNGSACGSAAPVSCTCYLAIATVPWQQFTNSYEPEQALRIGTMFPELDKPFLGRSVRS